MRQLTGLDTAFLQMENDRTIGHVSSLMVLRPTAKNPLNAAVVREYLRERIHLLAPMRWRLVTVPFGIDRPYWVDDPDVNFDYHVRAVALPTGAGEHELGEFIGRVVSRRLDRAYPLWEIYVIEGLPQGRVGLLTKVHHAAIDGASGVALTASLLAPSRAASLKIPEPVEIVPDTMPTPVEMFTKGWMGVAARPREGFDFFRRASADFVKGARVLAGGGLVGAALGTVRSAPKLSFNTTVSARRNFARGTMSMSTIKVIKDAHGCTVNDVVMAVCAGGLRSWLESHDELPDKPLVAAVPVSVRTADAGAAIGNQVSSVVAELPTHLEDPLERLLEVHGKMKVAKEVHNALPATMLTELTNFTAPAAAEFVARIAADAHWADRIALPYNLCISNVPGPRQTLYYAGAQLEAMYPISMISDGMGLNITLQSYKDGLHYGLVSTPELIPDLDVLVEHIDAALEELREVTPS